jgi:two-component system, NtrC family, response regulator AtoC
LYIPPLRERRDEILPLAQSFLAEVGGHSAPVLSAEVRTYLLQHSWPGNVRELRNIVRRAVVLCEGPEVSMEHLFVAAAGPRVARGRPGLPTAEPSLGAHSRPDVPVRPHDQSRPEQVRQRQVIVEALERFAGNQTKVARHLGISRTTLSARLDDYGIARPRKKR